MDGGRVPGPLSVPEGLDREVSSPYAYARRGSTSHGSRSPEGDIAQQHTSPQHISGRLPPLPVSHGRGCREPSKFRSTPHEVQPPARERRGLLFGPVPLSKEQDP